MENNIIEEIEITANEIVSQQTNSLNKPMIELYKGDKVQWRSDGIYVIRKLDFSINPRPAEYTMDSIRKQNQSI